MPKEKPAAARITAKNVGVARIEKAKCGSARICRKKVIALTASPRLMKSRLLYMSDKRPKRYDEMNMARA